MTPSQLFTRALQALFGAGSDWKAQSAAQLMIKPDSVDAMTKGTSRIPPGIWKEIADLLEHRARELPTLRERALEQVEASKGKVVFTIGSASAIVGGGSLMGGIPLGPIRWTDADIAELQRSLDDITRRNNLPRGTVYSVDAMLIHMEVPGTPDQSAMNILTHWFQVSERQRIMTLVSGRSSGQMIPLLHGPAQQRAA